MQPNIVANWVQFEDSEIWWFYLGNLQDVYFWIEGKETSLKDLSKKFKVKFLELCLCAVEQGFVYSLFFPR